MTLICVNRKMIQSSYRMKKEVPALKNVLATLKEKKLILKEAKSF
jgi:hypothetical protein